MSRYGRTEETTDGYKRIDVRFLHKHSYLRAGMQFSLNWSRRGVRIGWIQCRTTEQALILSYKHRSGEYEDWKSEEYPVRISHTGCNYGGQRPWLHCPAKGCGRRVAVLYGGAIFACRHCHQLTYESQREKDYERAMRRAQAIQERCGVSERVDDGLAAKPRGMHWSTYQRLESQYDHFVSVMNLRAAQRFGFFL